MQLNLLDRGAPDFDPAMTGLERIALDATSWVDVGQGFLTGHGALFEELRTRVAWQGFRRRMFERYVDVPRLTRRCDSPQEYPLVAQLQSALALHYGMRLASVSFALYRDGRDSVAWHADQELRHLPHSIVALVVLGEPRPFMLRPLGGGPSFTLRPGWGDVVVMGGECQLNWEHCVPKVRRASPRMSVMFRPENDGADAGREKSVHNVGGSIR